MPSNISKARLHKAFNEGRRSATAANAENPYDNSKLRQLWEKGRTQQLAGELKTPVPPLEHGETRAVRAPQRPPRPRPVSAPASRSALPPRRGRDFGGPNRRPGNQR